MNKTTLFHDPVSLNIAFSLNITVVCPIFQEINLFSFLFRKKNSWNVLVKMTHILGCSRTCKIQSRSFLVFSLLVIHNPIISSVQRWYHPRHSYPRRTYLAPAVRSRVKMWAYLSHHSLHQNLLFVGTVWEARHLCSLLEINLYHTLILLACLTPT